MLKNYLKIAFRNMRRGKVYTFINLAGLAVGMAFIIALATIGFQTVKAATANPVESLRYE